MKLMIDIPEEYLKTIKAIPDETSSLDMLLIKDGAPFDSVIEGIKKERYNQGFVDGYKKATEQANAVIDDIKTEIETLQSDTNVMMYSLAISDVLEIIDKHISGKEN